MTETPNSLAEIESTIRVRTIANANEEIRVIAMAFHKAITRVTGTSTRFHGEANWGVAMGDLTKHLAALTEGAKRNPYSIAFAIAEAYIKDKRIEIESLACQEFLKKVQRADGVL